MCDAVGALLWPWLHARMAVTSFAREAESTYGGCPRDSLTCADADRLSVSPRGFPLLTTLRSTEP